MATITNLSSTLDFTRNLLDTHAQATDHIREHANSLLDAVDQLLLEEGGNFDGRGYGLSRASASTVKFTHERLSLSEAERLSSTGSATFTGEHLDTAKARGPVTLKQVSLSQKETYSESRSDLKADSATTQSTTASIRYQPFADPQKYVNGSINLFSLAHRQSDMLTIRERANASSPETVSEEASQSGVEVKGSLSYRSGDLSGTLNQLLFSQSSETTSPAASSKLGVSLALASQRGVSLSGETASGTLDTLSFAQTAPDSANQSISTRYEGRAIDASVLTERDEFLAALLLFSGHDTITGTSGADDILGLGGRDMYTWDVLTGGADSVNLSRVMPGLQDVQPEEIDTVLVTGLGKSGQVRLTLDSTRVGNGLVNEASALNVQVQLETLQGSPTGDIARFDDEGMLFTAKSGFFDVRDASSVTSRGEQFKSIFLGSAAADEHRGGDSNDYLDGGHGNDVLTGGKANDYLAGGRGNDILNGGKGMDTLHGGTGADAFVIRQGDSSKAILFGLLQADTIIDFEQGVDTLQFDVAIDATKGFSAGPTAVNNFVFAQTQAMLTLNKLGKSEDKSAMFNFQFTETQGYLFQDYTGDGKIDQVIVLDGIQAGEISRADLISVVGSAKSLAETV